MIVPGGGYRNLHANEEVVMCEDGNERTLMNSFIQGTSVFTFTILMCLVLSRIFLLKRERHLIVMIALLFIKLISIY